MFSEKTAGDTFLLESSRCLKSLMLDTSLSRAEPGRRTTEKPSTRMETITQNNKKRMRRSRKELGEDKGGTGGEEKGEGEGEEKIEKVGQGEIENTEKMKEGGEGDGEVEEEKEEEVEEEEEKEEETGSKEGKKMMKK